MTEALAELLEGISAANVMTKFMIPLLKNAYSASDHVARFLSGTSRQVTTECNAGFEACTARICSY